MTTPAVPPIQQQVPWSYDLFSSQFPAVANKISPVQAQMFWIMATNFHRNDGGGPIRRDEEQALMLNLLTAHIAELLAPGPDGQPREVVGRITSFNEGSAGGSAEFPTSPEAAWYLQTPYGAMYWEMTAGQRTMFYTVAPRRRFDAWLPFPYMPWG